MLAPYRTANQIALMTLCGQYASACRTGHRHQPYYPSGKLIIDPHAVAFATILTIDLIMHAFISLIQIAPGIPPDPEPPLMGIPCLLVALIVSGVSKLVEKASEIYVFD